MTAANTVGFTFPRALLRSAGEWLKAEFDWTPPIIGAADDALVRARASEIGSRLLAQAARSRRENRGHIGVRLSRTDAQWIAAMAHPRSVEVNGRAVIVLVRIVIGALKRRRGRRALSTDALRQRASGGRKLDERHRWRCRARLRRREEFARNYASSRRIGV